MRAARFPRWVCGEGSEPDPRFTLANERTFLAWIRTALALTAGGVALEALTVPLLPGLRLAASLLLLVLGLAAVLGAHLGRMLLTRQRKLGSKVEIFLPKGPPAGRQSVRIAVQAHRLPLLLASRACPADQGLAIRLLFPFRRQGRLLGRGGPLDQLGEVINGCHDPPRTAGTDPPASSENDAASASSDAGEGPIARCGRCRTKSVPVNMNVVSPEALVFALSTVVRPTTTAAVFAILSAARPIRLLLVYIVTGLLFSFGVGVVVVALLQGWSGPQASDEVRAVIGIVLGALSLGYAAGLLSGRVELRVQDRTDDDFPIDSQTWLGRQLADLTPTRTAAAGVLTHLPGLFYLAALNAITNSTTDTLSRIFQVAMYNAIWFAMPTAALLLAAHRPAELQGLLRRLTGWVRRHNRRILIITFGLLGSYLTVKSGAELLA
jgi:uncharacterized membrane protein YidH (DUF202 family)